MLEETCLDCTAACPLASVGQPSVDENRDNTVCREKGQKRATVSSHLHSHCLCQELLGWDCKVIVNVNKVLREKINCTAEKHEILRGISKLLLSISEEGL